MDIRNFFGGGGKKTPASNKKKPVAKDTKAEDEKTKDETKPKSETKKTKTTEPAEKKVNDIKSKPKETAKSAVVTNKPLTMEQKRQAILAESSDDSDDEPVGKPAAIKKEPTRASPRKVKAESSDEQLEVATSPNKKDASPTRSSPRKRKGAAPSYSDSPKKVKEEKKKRKIYESSSDEEMNDDDFKADEGESDDEDFMEEDTKPKKTAPTKKRAASPKKAPAKKTKVEVPSIPKYHPPSSCITTEIPFLKDDPAVTIQPPAKLVMKGRTLTEAFNVDNMTPLCLEGLTFVFSGILTTDAAKSAAANAAVAIGSPSKGDYYSNRNAYTTSTLIGSDNELPRDIATDIVKMLGGRVTGSVSGKTDYLVVGSILEDGRDVEEGSKHRRCIELYEAWCSKYRSEYKEDKKKSKTKGSDPNSLVEIIRGVDEFWGLITFMSEWKKSTLPEEERAKVEASLSAVKKEPDVKPAAVVSAPAVSNPYASQKKPVNPYAKAPAPANPYAKSSAPANPYAKPANPYAKKSTPAPAPAVSEPAATAKPKPVQANALWADKYAPSNSREILGNADSVTKLFNWLRNWENQFNDPKRKPKSISGPNGPWKAALLSGPPGIGKTTTATLVARESNRDVIELNASDARSKKALTEALGDLSGTHAFSFGNANGKKNNTARKRCIIMDEVDGMGAGDRSGISELIQMIKKAKVPIICICNDRSSQKMRSLVQYCMDLRYRRPTKNVIATRAVEIGRLEGMVVERNAAEAMSESCGNDIRQVLNCLQMWSSKKNDDNTTSSLTFKELRDRKNDINKDEVLRVSMFDACKLLVEGSRGVPNGDTKAATTNLLKRSDAYFVDYMLMGLNVHQNYLKVSLGQYNSAKLKGDDEELEALNQLHEATLAMSDFGMCEEQLRGADQNWSLLPLCSMLAVKVRICNIIGLPS